MEIIPQYWHDQNPTRRNPTPIAQAQGWQERAWKKADDLFDNDALYIEAVQAAVIVTDLYTRRYTRWQDEGGQSNWSPIDKYMPDEPAPGCYNIFWGVQ